MSEHARLRDALAVNNRPQLEVHADWCRYTVMGHIGWTCRAWDPRQAAESTTPGSPDE